MNRHDSRIVIVRALYEIDLKKITLLDENILKKIINFAFDPTIEDGVLPLNDDNDSYSFIKETILSIINQSNTIDNYISKYMEKYTIERLNYVDRQIIRLAVFEMLYTDLAPTIIINEALEITKEYTNLDDGLQVKFNNKLLDRISQGIKNDE